MIKYNIIPSLNDFENFKDICQDTGNFVNGTDENIFSLFKYI